jgi:hypothetical protein
MTNSIDNETITITGATGTSWDYTNMSSPSYTISTPITGAQGSYTIGSNWLNDSISINNDIEGNTLHVKGNASFEGDVKIKGKSIADSIDRIEERLAILRPNEELEAKWENLRGLRNAYMELEAEIIEKEKVWSILKK